MPKDDKYWLGRNSQLCLSSMGKGKYLLWDITTQDMIEFTLDDIPHILNEEASPKNVSVHEAFDGVIIGRSKNECVFLELDEFAALQLYLS